jgi:hypothetical protein
MFAVAVPFYFVATIIGLTSVGFSVADIVSKK